jgi:proton-dependent oligopeptide transporter, POT family
MPTRPAERSIWRSGIILAGAAQRLGHYGIRSLLILYLINDLKLSGQQAGQVYGLFYGSFFVTAILGGVLGSSRRGYGWAGSLGLGLMLAGHVGLFLEEPTVTMVGLGIYIIGFGLFDTNLNVAIARKYEEERLRDSAYTVLYTAINIGAAIGPVLFGYLALGLGARYSFLLGGVWPLLGYWLFQRSTRQSGTSTAPQGRATPEGEQLGPIADEAEKSSHKRWLFLAILGLAGIVFAAVFDQLGSSVTLLAQGHVRRNIGPIEMPAGYVQSINPLFVILLGPIFALAIKHRQHASRQFSRVAILAMGLVLLGGGFGILSLAASGIGPAGDHATVSWAWVFLAIFLVTLGELVFAPIALSLVAGLATRRHQAFMVGAWTAMYGIGSYLSGTVAGFMESLGRFSLYWGISAVACWAVALLLWTTARTVHPAVMAIAAEAE